MNNPYTKFRYDNSLNVKFKVDSNTQTSDVYGTELRSYSSNIKSQLSDIPTNWLNNGATYVINNLFKCNQITKVDEPMVLDKNASKLTFFRLFKL